jgi:hypothetical protein
MVAVLQAVRRKNAIIRFLIFLSGKVTEYNSYIKNAETTIADFIEG